MIKKNITKKCIDMFEELAKNDNDKFLTFYKEFNKNIKLGVHDDETNRERL